MVYFNRKRSVSDNFLGHGFGSGQQLRWFVNVIDQADALRLFPR